MTVDVLLLRLDAPLMSFGAPMVDSSGVIQEFPALSMLTGLLGNALGWDHADHALLNALQDRIRYATRCDRRGEKIRDYQTVDLGQDFMDADKVGWTTRGRLNKREGGSAKDGTHIRERDFWADAVHTVALTLTGGASPTVADLEAALRSPARPLFIGRKACLPATQLLLGREENAASLLTALRDTAPTPPGRWTDAKWDGVVSAWWMDGEDEAVAEKGTRPIPVTDERDWRNQVHVGRRMMKQGTLRLRLEHGEVA